MFQTVIDEPYLKNKELYQFLTNVKFDNPMSVTLTEKQFIYGYNGYKFHIDNIRSVRNTKHFLNRLNQQIFKNSYRRFGQQLKSIVVMEGTKDIRHHLHMILDKPNRVTYEEFVSLIHLCWGQTKFGYHHIQIDPMTSDGWLKYILKCRTKINLLSDIDWENTNVGVSK